jgi:hypothetical protein
LPSISTIEWPRVPWSSRHFSPGQASLCVGEWAAAHTIAGYAALKLSGAQAAILRQTGQRFGTRQLRELTVVAAVDFKAFYEQRQRSSSDRDDVLVLSCDGA